MTVNISKPSLNLREELAKINSSEADKALVDGALTVKSAKVYGAVTSDSLRVEGDVVFTDDTGLTPKFFWDASAESLGIGTATSYGGALTLIPSANPTTASATTSQLRIGEASANTAYSLNINYMLNAGVYKGSLQAIAGGSPADLLLNADGGNVGIGTSSPSTYGVDGAEDLVIGQADGNHGITISSWNASNGTLAFTDTTNATVGRGYLDYDHAVNAMTVGTNGTERMRIDASGNVLVGKTSADFGATAGVEFRGDGRVATGRAGESLILNRITSDGDIALFRKDGTTVGSIGSNSGTRLSIGSADTGLLFVQDADDIIPFNTSTGAGRDNAIDLGQSGNRFKDAYLSGGVYLGGTGAANKLDDYEEGTWSGSLKEGANSFVNTGGSYTKIGNSVTVHWGVNFTVINANNGLLTLSGLPFTPSAAGLGSVTGRLLGTGVSNVVVMAVNNSGSLRFRQYTSSGYTDNVYMNDLLATNGAGSDYMWLSCTYTTHS